MGVFICLHLVAYLYESFILWLCMYMTRVYSDMHVCMYIYVCVYKIQIYIAIQHDSHLTNNSWEQKEASPIPPIFSFHIFIFRLNQILFGVFHQSFFTATLYMIQFIFNFILLSPSSSSSWRSRRKKRMGGGKYFITEFWCLRNILGCTLRTKLENRTFFFQCTYIWGEIVNWNLIASFKVKSNVAW